MKTPVAKEELGNYFTILANYQSRKVEGEAKLAQCSSSLEDLYQGAKTDWQHVLKCAEEAEKSAIELENIWGAETLRIEYASVKTLKDVLVKTVESANKFYDKKDDLYETLCIQESDCDDWYTMQIKMCDTIISNADSLKDWILWNSIAFDAKKSNFKIN